MPAWGGFTNGKIPANALVALSGGSTAEPQTAAAYEQLAAQFKTDFGTQLKVNSGYRDLAQQAFLVAHPEGPVTGAPGHSDHGWGTSLDLGSGIGTHYSQQNVWMHNHGPKTGFTPTGEGFTTPEYWHWQHGGTLTNTPTAATTKPTAAPGLLGALGTITAELVDPKFYVRVGYFTLGAVLLIVATTKIFSMTDTGKAVIAGTKTAATTAAKAAILL